MNSNFEVFSNITIQCQMSNVKAFLRSYKTLFEMYAIEILILVLMIHACDGLFDNQKVW